MAELVRNTPGNRFQNEKGDNTIIDLTQKTQNLSISSKSDKFGQYGQNKKCPNNLKRQLEQSISEYELPSIIYKPIANNKENFQILVDEKGKINGNPFKTKYKRKKVRFSEHHELSDEEIINEIERYFKIIEERDKKLQDTHHISFLDRTLNNKEEPDEWQLESPTLIQKPPNKDDETKYILENEYNYFYLPYITFEKIFGDEAQGILCEDKYLCHLPGENSNKIQFLELLTEAGIKGNLSNQLWDKSFSMGILPRRGLYFNQIWARWYLGLNGATYQTGRLKWVEDEYIFIDCNLWWSEFASEREIEEINAFMGALKDLILASLLKRNSPFALAGVELYINSTESTFFH
ncbi:hypothetical protein O181_064450 [Austropuccinia psidii MF-1]|uniref:Uncharacterized protein n=1 Tax=Austropuccinia psidii MF-1 TaxID=1389203 RepID=A0A9Q3ET65_9BASI|nr:hypothetical protein [Austropuccinia psidii MF-1]